MSLLPKPKPVAKEASAGRILTNALLANLGQKMAFTDQQTIAAGDPTAMMGGPMPGGMAPPGAMMPPGAPPAGPQSDPAAAGAPPADPAAAGGPPPTDPAAAGGAPTDAASLGPPPPPPGPADPAAAGTQPGANSLDGTMTGAPAPELKVDTDALGLVTLRILAMIADKLGLNLPLSIMTVLPPELNALPKEPPKAPSGPEGGDGSAGGAGALQPPAPIDPMQPAMGGAPPQQKMSAHQWATSMAYLAERANTMKRG